MDNYRGEKYETIYDHLMKKKLVHYKYRISDNHMFCCVRPTLKECRNLKNIWLKKIEIKGEINEY